MSDPLKRLSWDDLRIVKAIGETGSLAAGASVLGVNNSTMFRRLAQVEEALFGTSENGGGEICQSEVVPSPCYESRGDCSKR